jgi:hypothetical protein
MAFTPVSLPIQEILLTNFVTDIASISNANSLLLKDKLEDVVNLLEIDLTAISIGTDTAINSIKTKNVIIQETGLIFQTGTPNQIIARLEKNSSTQSVFTVDKINVNIDIDTDSIVANSVTVNDALISNGPTLLTSSLEFSAQLIESKETVTATLTNTGPIAEARITLTSGSKKNILVKLSAVTSPNLNYVYDGVSAFAGGITKFVLYVDFDAVNPPAQNSTFTISFVDIVENITSTSILTTVNGTMPVVISGGQNLSALPTPVPIYLHDGTYDIGVNPISTNPILNSNIISYYGNNATFLYILDENTDDRLIVTSTVGMEFF